MSGDAGRASTPGVDRGDAAWWADKIGRLAVFRYHHGEEVVGQVTSANDRFVFVRFGQATSSEACDPSMLRLAFTTEGGDRG